MSKGDRRRASCVPMKQVDKAWDDIFNKPTKEKEKCQEKKKLS